MPNLGLKPINHYMIEAAKIAAVITYKMHKVSVLDGDNFMRIEFMTDYPPHLASVEDTCKFGLTIQIHIDKTGKVGMWVYKVLYSPTATVGITDTNDPQWVSVIIAKLIELGYAANHCKSGRDGDCEWSGCPQNRDGEPKRTNRHCPLDVDAEARGGC